MKLGGSNDSSEAFPQKPRGMHWRTYRRLRDQANAADAEADYLLAKSIPGLGQFLDFMPPRPKRQLRRHDGGPKPSPSPSLIGVHIITQQGGKLVGQQAFVHVVRHDFAELLICSKS